MTYNMYLSDMRLIKAVGLACLLFLTGTAMGQDQKKLPDFNSIRTPNSPAFSVLGIQPTSIERPNTPADLAISLDNATEGFSKFPQNYSIEFAPYWLSKEPMSLTWRDDIERSIEESIKRTFAISFATTNKQVKEKEVRGLSYGVRALILSGKMTKKSEEQIKKLENDLTSYSKKVFEMDSGALRIEFQKRMLQAATIEEKQLAVAWYNNERTRQNEKRVEEENSRKEDFEDEGQTFAPQRDGLILELAYAGAYKNDTINAELKKNGYAFWVTPAYVQEDYSVVGVYRQLKDSVGIKSTEFGVRLVCTKSRYAISVEYLKGEYQSETPMPNRERFSILVEYLLSKNVWLNLSFGDDNKNPQGVNKLFSSVGLKYNLSSKRYSF